MKDDELLQVWRDYQASRSDDLRNRLMSHYLPGVKECARQLFLRFSKSDSFHVDLPFERDRSLKRSTKFKNMVDEVEDRMEALAVHKKVVRLKKGGLVEAVK